MKTGVLADIHEDIASLEAALHWMEQARCDEVVCLGDILGFDERYYNFRPDGESCLRLIRENCVAAVAGNHDLIAVDRIPAFTGGFEYPGHWSTLSPEQRRYIAGNKLWDYHPDERDRKLSDRSLEFLQSLPESMAITRGPFTIFLSHYLFPDPCGTTTRELRYATGLWPHLYMMKEMNCSTAMVGHTHYPGLRMGRRHGMVSSAGSFRVTGTQRRIFFIPPVVRNRNGQGVTVLDTGNGMMFFDLLHG